MLFACFVYIAYLTKFSRGRLLPIEKSLPMGKSKEEKVLLNT